jgi:hypothetical protein
LRHAAKHARLMRGVQSKHEYLSAGNAFLS